MFVFDYWPASQGRLSSPTANAVIDLVERRGGLSDHLELDLAQAAFGEPVPGYVGITVRDSFGDDWSLKGYGQVSAGNGTDLIEIVADGPLGPGDSEFNLVAAVLDAAIDAQALYHPGSPALWWTDTNRQSEQLADQRGLVRRRLLYRMDINLSDPFEPVLATRAFRPDDTASWLRVNNAAFAGHSEQGGWSRQMFEQRQSEEWFDPNGLRIAELDGEMVGFCWTKIHTTTAPGVGQHAGRRDYVPGTGEIYVIAVHPDHAGRGLGTGLVLAGLESMRASGVSEAMLYVDADNRAIQLYDRLGFKVASSRSAYETTRA